LELTPFTAVLWAVFAICATAAIVARIRGRVRLGFGVRRPTPGRDVAVGLGIGLIAIGLIFGTEVSRGAIDIESTRLNVTLFGHALTFLIPFAIFEEVALRGLLLVGVLAMFRRPWIALLVSAVVFGLAHAPNPDATWVSIASATLGGAMYSLAFLRTGRIWLPLSLHLGWNLSQAVFGFAISGVTDYSTLLVTQTHHGPWWITGGAYGPEGGLLGIGARLVVIGLVLLATRRRQPSPLLTPASGATVNSPTPSVADA
jgi:membrane protease YdiL (CAAX protease family)